MIYVTLWLIGWTVIHPLALFFFSRTTGRADKFFEALPIVSVLSFCWPLTCLALPFAAWYFVLTVGTLTLVRRINDASRTSSKSAESNRRRTI